MRLAQVEADVLALERDAPLEAWWLTAELAAAWRLRAWHDLAAARRAALKGAGPAGSAAPGGGRVHRYSHGHRGAGTGNAAAGASAEVDPAASDEAGAAVLQVTPVGPLPV